MRLGRGRLQRPGASWDLSLSPFSLSGVRWPEDGVAAGGLGGAALGGSARRASCSLSRAQPHRSTGRRTRPPSTSNGARCHGRGQTTRSAQPPRCLGSTVPVQGCGRPHSPPPTARGHRDSAPRAALTRVHAVEVKPAVYAARPLRTSVMSGISPQHKRRARPGRPLPRGRGLRASESRKRDALAGPGPVGRDGPGFETHVLSDVNGLPLRVGISAAGTYGSQALKPMLSRFRTGHEPHPPGSKPRRLRAGKAARPPPAAMAPGSPHRGLAPRSVSTGMPENAQYRLRPVGNRRKRTSGGAHGFSVGPQIGVAESGECHSQGAPPPAGVVLP